MRILRPVTVFLSLLLIVGASQAQERARAVNAALSNQVQVRQVTDPTYIQGGSRV